jgi:predicted nucleic acid-binding protein
LRNSLFVDTSAWCALADDADPDHAAVATCIRANRGRLVTSTFVFDETVTHLRYHVGWRAAQALGEEIMGGRIAPLIRITADDEHAAWAIFLRYRDHRLSFTDCTSFAVMRRLKLDVAVTLDDDFRSFGMTCMP